MNIKAHTKLTSTGNQLVVLELSEAEILRICQDHLSGLHLSGLRMDINDHEVEAKQTHLHELAKEIVNNLELRAVVFQDALTLRLSDDISLDYDGIDVREVNL